MGDARDILDRLPVVGKMGILLLAALVPIWLILDVAQSGQTRSLVAEEYSQRLAEKAHKSRLRFDAALRSHHVFARTIAASFEAHTHIMNEHVRPSMKEGAAPTWSSDAIETQAPAWFPKAGMRRVFPPVDFVLVLNRDGAPLDGYAVNAKPYPQSLHHFNQRRIAIAVQEAQLRMVEDIPYLFSVGDVLGDDRWPAAYWFPESTTPFCTSARGFSSTRITRRF